ncbi:MAG: hypothetical protein KY475_20490 [Planctomycetes bacterium]|nr:hypothetical protein [Planctomycetota bacterium]
MRLFGFGALAIAVSGAFFSGCCAPIHCGDGAPHHVAAAVPCGPAPCGPCGPAPCLAQESFSPQCVACGVNGPCPKHSGGRGLLGFLWGVCCGSSCGEFYIHPWINDPPHPCDPCDHHGNWIGPRPCGPPACSVGACPAGWHNLWGYRGLVGHCGAACGEVGHPIEHYGEPLHAPTLAPPQEVEEIETPTPPGAAPMPPEFPGPAEVNTGPRPRSALKKIDGRPAVYYSRRPGPVLR